MTGHRQDAASQRGWPGPRGDGAAVAAGAAAGAAAPAAAYGLGRLAEAAVRAQAALDAAGDSVDARALVDRATGVLMERLGCGPEEALRHLHARARAEGRAVLRCAGEIVSGSAARGSGVCGTVSVSAAAFVTGPVSGSALPGWHAEDGQRAVAAILEHALRPFGADSVNLWAAREDGGLRLAGRAGVRATTGSPAATSDLAAQAVRSGAVVWTKAEPAAAAQGRGRAVTVAVPAVRRGRVLGALEISWTAGAPVRDHRVDRQLLALADLAAHTMDGPAHRAVAPTGPPGTPGTPGTVTGPRGALGTAGTAGTADGPWGTPGTVGAHRVPGAAAAVATAPSAEEARPAGVDPVLRQLAESLSDPALVLTPLFDAEGRLSDFRIAHVNDRFADPAGRPAAQVEGRPLLQAYPGFGRAGGPAEKAQHVYATGESFRADRMALVAGTGDRDHPVVSQARVGVSRVNDAVLLTWRARRSQEDDPGTGQLLQHAQRLGCIGGFEDDLLTSRSTWNQELYELFGLAPDATPMPLSHLRTRVHRDDRDAFDTFLAGVTLHQEPRDVAVRFHRSDQVVRHVRVVAEPVVDDAGALVAIRGACQDVSAHHWTEVALSATRDQLVHTQAEADEQARLALRLQHAIMPPTPGTVTMAGLTIGVRYRPAHEDHAVGGDWYDAVPLPNGDVLVSVGDVAGHGIEAATGMVALRNALRGLATTGAGPGQLLTWLNDVAFHFIENVTATAVCGIYQPDQRRFRWARAGHPAPVLLHQGASSCVDFVNGILLGAVPDAAYREHEMTLPEGATLLLFTDGLIERKDSSGLDDLHTTLGSASFPGAGSLAEQLDHLLAHSRSDTDDDTCLVGIHRPVGARELTAS